MDRLRTTCNKFSQCLYMQQMLRYSSELRDVNLDVSEALSMKVNIFKIFGV